MPGIRRLRNGARFVELPSAFTTSQSILQGADKAGALEKGDRVSTAGSIAANSTAVKSTVVDDGGGEKARRSVTASNVAAAGEALAGGRTSAHWDRHKVGQFIRQLGASAQSFSEFIDAQLVSGVIHRSLFAGH